MSHPNTVARPSSVDRPSSPKQAYQAPVIEQFGDIRTMTLAKGMSGMLDGGTGMGMNQTNA